MILKMGRLAKSAKIRASKMEKSVPEMVEREIAAGITPVQASVLALTLTVTTCKTRHNRPSEISALQVEVVNLWTYVDSLK